MNKRICKCKRIVTIKPEWSYFCLDCGRYTYDNGAAICDKEKTIDNLQTCLVLHKEYTKEKRNLIRACIKIAKLKKEKKIMKKKINKEPKFMFAIVSKDVAGETIQLFKTKKQAEMFLKVLKKSTKE